MAAPKQKKNTRSGVLVCGAYGMGNAGDEAILEAIVSELRSVDADMPITVMTRDPAATAQKFGVKAVYTLNPFAFLPAMRRSAVYLNGGGSLIQDVTSSRSLLYYLFTLRAAKRLGCRVLMYGCGIGPVKKPRNRACAAKVLNRYVDAVTLRESHSAKTLAEFGVTEPEIILASDPALTLQSATEEETDAEMTRLGLAPHGKYICFCMRPWSGFESKAAELARAADSACETLGLTPVFISINHLNDGESADAVAERMSAQSIIIRRPLPTPLMLGVMSRMTVCVSMRLHGLIFAAGRCVPSVGVGYDPKVSAFLDYLGRPRCVSLEDLTADKLTELIMDAAADDRESLAASVERLKAAERRNTDTVRRMLGLDADDNAWEDNKNENQ
ncbi:MAG: polysaccharide pyruvyl transferase CsaB [Oscillospiraceae bacterium]|nr:polysaccharide pyruvyl transferase CsaB [Oscillospiraceae bacterium]